MKYLAILVITLLLLPIGIAETFKNGENVTISHAVTVGGDIDGTLIVNVTVRNPNNTVLAGLAPMTYDSSSGEYTYTLSGTNTSLTGNYPYVITATNGMFNETEQFYFTISRTGKDFDQSESIASIGIMFGALALSFFFLIFGFKFTGDSKTMPLALLFIVIAIVMGIYSLYLGVSYSAAILEYEPFISTQTTVFLSILWLVSGIGIISFILMTIGFVREFGKGKMMKNYGEGFDPVTQTYT